MHIIYYIATRHFPTVSHIFSRHDRFGARPKSADHSRARARMRSRTPAKSWSRSMSAPWMNTSSARYE